MTKPSDFSGASLFGKILGPVATESFFHEHFESKPLLVQRNLPEYFSGILTLDDVDRIITTFGVPYPDIRLVNAERLIESAEFTRRGKAIDVSRLYSLYAAGATIILDSLDSRHPPLAELCAALELEFSAPFQTNVYLTPPHSKGFKAHLDTHDVFILQLHGSKRWRLYGTPVVLPLSGYDDEAEQGDPGPPTSEFVLNAGDTLYIPRGVVHDAVSSDAASLHVTVGFHTYTWTDAMLETMAAAVLKDPAFRRSLPVGFARENFDREIARHAFRSLVERFSASADIDTTLDTFAGEFLDGRRPRLRGQMAQLRASEGLTGNSLVGCRPHLGYTIDEDEAAIRVRCYRNEIRIPRYAGNAVRYALTSPRFRVSDLPGELDDGSKLVLVKRLVREGMLAVVDPAS